MKAFNLSGWALRHRALVTFFMGMIMIAGVADYFALGRSEDPDFTVKTMVVAAIWPGATVEDTLEQVTRSSTSGRGGATPGNPSLRPRCTASARFCSPRQQRSWG